jgi:hypothetical protein
VLEAGRQKPLDAFPVRTVGLALDGEVVAARLSGESDRRSRRDTE